MSTSAAGIGALAVRVTFDDDCLCVALADGREIRAPLSWFPRLLAATPAQREHFRFIGGGMGIHWPEIDEDVSVGGLLLP